MNCIGCGRLQGLRTPMECPCWRSMNHGALIPVRIRGFHKRIVAAHEGISRAQTDQEKLNAAAVARQVNTVLRGIR